MSQRVIFLFFLLSATMVLGGWGGESFAGPLVFGPQTYTWEKGGSSEFEISFEVQNPEGIYWLQIDNGDNNGQNLVKSATVFLNGVKVVKPKDFQEDILGVQKDVMLQRSNVMKIKLRGQPGSFITVQIREAEPNPTVSDPEGHLTGLNYGNQIALWWSRDERAEEYVFFRSTSKEGPWEEAFRIEHKIYRSGAAVDGPPDVDPRVMDLCYKINAVDANGRVVREYEPVCVPKYVEKQRPQGSSRNGTPSFFNEGAASFQEAAPEGSPINDLCLSDDQFVDTNTFDPNAIYSFLANKGGFLRKKIDDVDGILIDPAQEIFNAAQAFRINPQVLLTALQKEQSALTSSNRLSDERLQFIMGYGTPSTIRDQIRDAAAQFRRDFDRLTNGDPTAGGWQVGVPKSTLDPIIITPASKAATILYSYTPWVGKAFGGNPKVGGNALFCQVWEDFGFDTGLPDLQGGAVDISIHSEDTSIIDIVVYNSGTGVAGTTTHEVYVAFDGVRKVGEVSSPSLAPGESISVSLTFRDVDHFCVGVCIGVVVVDAPNAVRESREENNCESCKLVCESVDEEFLGEFRKWCSNTVGQ